MAGITWSGTEGNDVKYGTSSRDMLSGGLGNDTLYGLKGFDILVGDAGDDTLYAGDANGSDNSGNKLFAGAGSDKLYGGTNNDLLFVEVNRVYTKPTEYTANFTDGGGGLDTIYITWENRLANGKSTSVFLDFGDGNFTVRAGSRNWDVVRNVELLYYLGSDAGDIISGGKYGDVVYLGIGNDTFRGMGGGDFIVERGGVLDIDGGDGVDRLAIELKDMPTSAQTVIRTGNVFQFSGNLLGTVKNVERFEMKGSDFDDRLEGGDNGDLLIGMGGNDTLKSWNGDDILLGYEGDDTLSSGNGSDDVKGGDGNDVISSGTGARDVLDGGTGIDKVTYTGATRPVVASLIDQSINTNDAKGDRYISIENLTGSKFDDTLYGNDQANFLSGGAGDDHLIGGGGRDTLRGGEGQDHLEGMAGHYNTLDYRTSLSGVTVNLAANTASGGDAQGDEISGFQIVRGSDSGDKLTCAMSQSTAYGYAGNDTLVAGQNGSTLVGGAGADALTGSANSDVFVFNSLSDSKVDVNGRDVIKGFSNTSGKYDRIDLTAIDAKTGTGGNEAFLFKGAVAFSGSKGELIYEKTTSSTYVYADVNGDKIADFAIHLDLAVDLASRNFLL